MTKERKAIKCEGRFNGLRTYLYGEVLPIVMEERNIVTEQDLSNSWELMKDDVCELNLADPRDPYFTGNPCIPHPQHKDIMRKSPNENFLSLVPLIESPTYSIENKMMIEHYSLSMGNSPQVSHRLADFVDNQRNYLERVIQRTPKSIVLPSGQNLSGYHISSDFGVGTIIHGGIKGGGIRSDSPFLINVYDQYERNEINLAAVIGFWAQDDAMLVSQIQSSSNARLPEGVPFGVAGLYLAQILAQEIGFKKIMTYSARKHPIFSEHPEDWIQFGPDFVIIYDNSAKKLGFDGGRTEVHEKRLK